MQKAGTAQPLLKLKSEVGLQQAQVEVLSAVAANFNRLARPGLSAEVATSVRDIVFQTGDLAADCFHPGVAGHARIARQLLDHELKSRRLNPAGG